MNSTPAQMWESRYGNDPGFVYGTEPNDFLKSAVEGLSVGTALCLADGEGRNGVFLATLGHSVTSVDLSANGMAKAKRLAHDQGVELTAVVADLAEYDFGSQKWDLIVSIFAHTPPPIRNHIHSAIATALRPNGHFILEAYTPDQIGRGTGGPPVAELTMTLEGVRSELAGMSVTHGVEMIRPVVEGTGHSGDGAVVQVIASPISVD